MVCHLDHYLSARRIVCSYHIINFYIRSMSNRLHRKHRREIKRKQERKKLRMMKMAADRHNKVGERQGMLYQKAPIDPISEYKAAKERKRELHVLEARHRSDNKRRNHL